MLGDENEGITNWSRLRRLANEALKAGQTCIIFSEWLGQHNFETIEEAQNQKGGMATGQHHQATQHRHRRHEYYGRVLLIIAGLPIVLSVSTAYLESAELNHHHATHGTDRKFCAVGLNKCVPHIDSYAKDAAVYLECCIFRSCGPALTSTA